MQEDKHLDENNSNTTVEPFNSATDHYSKIMGVPNTRADLKTMPKPVRYFYYFVVGFIVIGFTIMLYTAIFK
ncbi:hypothetical protein SAMN03159341_106355 [Paenibacillus sp. 1_12]|uniref:hypothetical protein n=1 Tax=Paenibacillus sp. 1_12 TaxID=1566278 RepID=UPI0008E56E3B|nr:hypothetical protein [Paenibacillus sp. 1_12]SFL49450.1 hypothetical protein SAMN03159341_106355 [Paenibacillus sp. 1_12]